MKDNICITYPSYLHSENFPVWLFYLVCVTIILTINEVDFVVRDVEAVTGGDTYVQSIAIHFLGDSSSKVDTHD